MIHLDPINQAGAPTETRGHEGPLVPTLAATGSVVVASDPPGAEIYIDSNFEGQTPSTVRIAEGMHPVELKLPGKLPWSSDLTVTKESQLSLRPILAASP